MKREFFCTDCGLFHWGDQYITDPESGRIDYNPKASRCPNPECTGEAGYAVDTFGFAYFCESDVGKEILQKKWSSLQYASADSIEIYRKQGMRIEGDMDE